MIRRSVSLLVALALCGCGSKPESYPLLELPPVAVIDLQNREAIMARDKLIDPDTGRPTVKSILVVDRNTGQQQWMPAETVLTAPSYPPRYMPVPQETPATEAPPESSQVER